MKTIVVEVDGRIHVADLTGLTAWQQAVGGDVQIFSFGDCSALVNENGKIEDLPENITATLLCSGFDVGLAEDDYINGVMLIVGPPDEDGETTDVTPNMLTQLKLAGGPHAAH